MLVTLTPHPDTPSTSVERIEVSANRVAKRLLLEFRLDGDTARIRAAAPGPAERTDGLWAHTCFEAFVQTKAGYLEFNLATTGQWASYRFVGYRDGMTPAHETISLASLEGRGSYLDVGAVIELPDDATGPIGLSAVIEDIDGAISYWALAHPSDKPDFHHPDSFVLELP